MIDKIIFLLKVLAFVLPFILLALLSNKANLKKQDRSRQCYMPFIAVLYCLITGATISPIVNLVMDFINKIPVWLNRFADWLAGLFSGKLVAVADWIAKMMDKFEHMLETIDLTLWAGLLVNIFIIGAFIALKAPVIRFLKLFCKEGKKHYETFAGLVYYKDGRKGTWFVKDTFTQGVLLLKVFYIVTLILAPIGVCVTAFMFDHELTSSLFYPVFSVIMVGEVYFYFNGRFNELQEGSLEGEREHASEICDYTLMRNVLRRNFGDKLLGENTTVNNDLLYYRTNDELLKLLEEDDDAAVESYGKFMHKKTLAGLELDQNYLMSGLELLKGRSILFNNPFYYDLIPYAFYPMNRSILRRKKVLIVLGRHAIEDEIMQWCNEGLTAVNHMPELWSIEVLDAAGSNPDVGIITRSQVHDLKLHEANEAFFKDVEFVMLIEPSKLVSTAQIGLNSLVRHCRRDGKKLVFCSTDKNCDGIVDALSHILMTSLEAVSATKRHGGTSSYMCWEVDEDHLQHRMLPNLTRYLGVGTELSFTALKNQISKTYWYGGDAFPVRDMHWIVKQYHYDLLNYAALPTQQTLVDEVFEATPNMWKSNVEDYKYITVEDENYNMFEVQREFSTRAKKQGFINVVSSDYLLKDYMAANDSIFHADSKAIPYIVADYAGTERNIIYRICLRLSSYMVPENEIARELSLIDMDTENIADTLWKSICKCSQSAGLADVNGEEELHTTKNGKKYVFGPGVIKFTRKYSFKTGELDNFYSIDNKEFVDVFLGDLCSAEYIAEDEKGDTQYLGSELRGQVFQKYLPGQFFTFGGKYYEMLRLTADGTVVVRRAADHINGRPQYRQIRNYTLSNVQDTGVMGDIKDIGGIKVTKQNADILVETPAYWRMSRYNDFATGKRITLNGVPNREYHNKQILKIEFGDKVSAEVVHTMTLLINEIFRTLYADNQGMIAAVCAGELDAPFTYSLAGADGYVPSENSIYIIEDSQLDIGLLVSVERNLNRIFSIMCDYLKWHTEAYEESINPPKEETEKPDYTNPEEGDKPKKERKGIFKFFAKIGGFFKKLFSKIAAFFKKLFGRKKKKDKPVAEGTGEGVETAAIPVEGADGVEYTPTEETEGDAAATLTGETEEEATVTDEETDTAAVDGETPDYDEFGADEESDTEITDQDGTVTDEPIDEETAEDGDSTEVADEETEEEDEDTISNESMMFFSISAPRYLANTAPEDGAAEAPETAEEPAAEGEEAETPEAPAEGEPTEGDTEGEAPAEGELEFEPAGETAVREGVKYERKPYHERFYMLYGFDAIPESLNVTATLEALTGLGYDNGFLEQARKGKNVAENIEKSFDPNRANSHYCDFCGVELLGTEYEILADGRERCMSCGRTAVKTEEEFRKLYEDVIRNLKVFYGVVINEPVKIQMVNSKKLHSRLGKQFVPTGKADGRVLGVAIKDKDGYSLLIENGSPRISATLTMVHELTHIWQYINWDAKEIKKLYGASQNLEIYEGMAKWSEIQYAYLINESVTGKREEILTTLRDDEYGRGFVKYVSVYPLSEKVQLEGETPFTNPKKPL